MTSTASAQDGYVMAAIAAHLHDLMARSGYPAEKILAHAALTREELAPRNGRLPLEKFSRLLNSAVAVTQEPQLLLKLSQVTFTNGFGVVGYLAQSCPTLQDALEGLIRYGLLVSSVGEVRIEHRPGDVLWRLNLERDDPVLVRQGVEYFFGVSYRFFLLLDARRSEIVREVMFMHDAPQTAAAKDVYAHLFSCPVRFSAPCNAMVLAPKALTTPLRLADVTLKQVIEQQAEKKLGELDDSDAFPMQVRKELEVLIISRQASREALAERLGVSGRHLGRLLAKAGLGYRKLVDEIRLSMARALLKNSTRTVADIGDALGFEDAPSFIRWFRKAAGCTPGEFRAGVSS